MVLHPKKRLGWREIKGRAKIRAKKCKSSAMSEAAGGPMQHATSVNRFLSIFAVSLFPRKSQISASGDFNTDVLSVTRLITCEILATRIQSKGCRREDSIHNIQVRATRWSPERILKKRPPAGPAGSGV